MATWHGGCMSNRIPTNLVGIKGTTRRAMRRGVGGPTQPPTRGTVWGVVGGVAGWGRSRRAALRLERGPPQGFPRGGGQPPIRTCGDLSARARYVIPVLRRLGFPPDLQP